MVRTAQAAEVSSTTSIPGPCSGPQTTPAILEYQPAETYCYICIKEKCALFVASVLICKICALLLHYVHNM